MLKLKKRYALLFSLLFSQVVIAEQKNEWGYALSPSLPVWALALEVLVTLFIGLVSLVSMPIWLNLLFIVTGVVLMTVPLMMVSVGYWLSYLPILVVLVLILLLSGARFLLVKKALNDQGFFRDYFRLAVLFTSNCAVSNIFTEVSAFPTNFI